MSRSKIITGLKEAAKHARKRNTSMQKGKANWTYDDEAGAWYFALHSRAKPPYLKQRRVEAIIDLDAHGRLAGVELLEPIEPSHEDST